MRSWSAGNGGEQRDRCVGGAGMGVFVGLFPASDSDSEDEQDQYVHRRRDVKEAPAVKKSEAAVWSLFPDKDGESIPQPADASAAGVGRIDGDGASPGVANRMWRSFRPSSDKVAGEPSGSSQKRKKTKTKKNGEKVEVGKEQPNKATPSPILAAINDKDADDVEAARCRTRSPSASKSWSPGAPPDKEASDEFEVTNRRYLSATFEGSSAVNMR